MPIVVKIAIGIIIILGFMILYLVFRKQECSRCKSMVRYNTMVLDKVCDAGSPGDTYMCQDCYAKCSGC